MASIGLITGSGYYRPGEGRAVGLRTRWGDVTLDESTWYGHRVLSLCRHGDSHDRLSHQVQHRANLWAMRELDVDAVVATTSVGVLDPAIGLGVPLVFSDLFFPGNRLPDGSLTTFFDRPGDPLRGHWVPDQPFSPALRRHLVEACAAIGEAAVETGTYAHADGPRFNTRAELAWLRSAGAVGISQTCGPEAVLAGELGIPYALLGFGVNYVAGLAVPAGGEAELETLLARHPGTMSRVIGSFLERLPTTATFACDTGFVYRMERG